MQEPQEPQVLLDPSRASVLRIHADAREDSLMAAYALLVVAPLCALVARWLLRRGPKTTPSHVVLLSTATPLVLIGLPALYEWFYGPLSVYRLLKLSRLETPHAWARRYAFWRDLYMQGQMPPEIWSGIDAAYDHIYDEKARLVYDFWGPGAKDMTLLETQVHVGLFYVLWGGIIYALTTSKATARASTWAFTGLVGLFGFELAVRLLHYDLVRVKGVLPFMTPRDLVLWAHRLFPIFVFSTVTIKRVFFVDMETHQQMVLHHMLEKNQKTTKMLQDIATEMHRSAEAQQNEQ